ncbi:hypothetical protein AB0I10_33645 [Streptomyces sp. NPDC050636]|uniref:hypothetical protein n=1 Tax=Streptomyces sp. NPDC050636 TaxID=3154510 RepID=UPI003438520E
MSILPWRRRARSVPAAAGTDMAHPLVMSERMPSHIASVYFTVRVNGAWRPTHDEALDHQEPAALARHHLRQNIARVLCRHSVLHLAAAQDAANTALMRWLRPAAGLEVTGAVALTASAHDRDLAEENARRQQTADLEHEDELRRLAHLQRVLADPDLRRVWWIAQYPDRHSDLEDLATNLEGLPLPQESPDDDIRGDIRRFTDRLYAALHTPQQREVFLKALTQTLHTLGHHDLTAMAAHWQTHSEPGSTPA